jgi:steroid C-25 hydroxylase gamma subunit
MLAKRLSGPPDVLLDPASNDWQVVPAEAVQLASTPLDKQPNRYIRNLLQGRSWGAASELVVQAAHDGDSLYFRLTWQDPSENRSHREGEFPDAAAVMFPVNGKPSLETMGSPHEQVNAWFWRPELEPEPEEVVGSGFGSLVRKQGAGLRAHSAYAEGVWTVVISKVLSHFADNGSSSLAPGGSVAVAFAVWEGSGGERAGIKAYSRAWRDLQLEA